jgi:hypothetical protein
VVPVAEALLQAVEVREAVEVPAVPAEGVRGAAVPEVAAVAASDDPQSGRPVEILTIPIRERIRRFPPLEMNMKKI